MKKLRRISVIILLMCCILFIPKQVNAKTYKFSGTYYGYNLYSGDFTKIVLKTNKKMKVYIDGEKYGTFKVKKFKTNKYKISKSAVRIKLYSNKIKVYSADGRDGKIPFGGTFRKAYK